jgi:2-polyprenyl-6-methoxyphenol hydroxylase-like FAD-dependent oxidoreductase
MGRICLTGDAGAVAPPFTGSGIFKAAGNAINLRTALDAFEDVDEALEHWNASETKTARELVDLGAQYDDAFINHIPDLAAMDPAEAAEWWARSVQHPEGFTFEVG